jgi:hypothetical protein
LLLSDLYCLLCSLWKSQLHGIRLLLEDMRLSFDTKDSSTRGIGIGRDLTRQKKLFFVKIKRYLAKAN